MCGCSGGSGYSFLTSGTCGAQGDKLRGSREKLAILYNHVKDEELKARYKEDRLEIEEMIRQANLTETCPDLETVILIETEVNNEYAKYFNT
jgi:hypothetical protein